MRKVFFSLFLVLMPSLVSADPGAAEVRAGNDHYRKGKFHEALEYYEKAAQKAPLDPRIEYDLGVAAYSTGDHAAAVGHFQKALLSDDENMKRNAHFNMGDALYRQGMAVKDKNIEQAIKALETSLVSFEKARAIDVKDVQSAENYEFVKEQIERLKQQQQQQKQQQEKQQQQQDQQQDDQQQDKDQNASQDQKKDPSSEHQQQEERQQDPSSEGEQGKDGQNKDQQGQKKDDETSAQEQQKPEEQDKFQDDKQGDPKPGEDEKDAPSGQKDEGQISSQKDANAKLDDFERNELPKGLLNFNIRSKEMRAVEKDW